MTGVPIEWRSDPQASTARAPAGPSFWQALVLGVGTVVFGIAVLAWPDESVRLLGVLTGIWLVLTGVVRILTAFVTWEGRGWQALSGIVGVLFVVGGVACLRDVAKGVLVLAFLVAVAWICVGLAELVAAIGQEGATRIWLGVLGAGSIVIGFVFLLWPEPSLTALAILVGVSGLVIGVGEIAFAVRLRRGTT